MNDNYEDGEEEEYDSGTEEYFQSHLFKAAELGDYEEIEKCLNDDCDVDLDKDDTNETALIIVCREGHNKILQLLLDHDASINPHPMIINNGLQVYIFVFSLFSLFIFSFFSFFLFFFLFSVFLLFIFHLLLYLFI